MDGSDPLKKQPEGDRLFSALRRQSKKKEEDGNKSKNGKDTTTKIRNRGKALGVGAFAESGDDNNTQPSSSSSLKPRLLSGKNSRGSNRKGNDVVDDKVAVHAHEDQEDPATLPSDFARPSVLSSSTTTTSSSTSGSSADAGSAAPPDLSRNRDISTGGQGVAVASAGADPAASTPPLLGRHRNVHDGVDEEVGADADAVVVVQQESSSSAARAPEAFEGEVVPVAQVIRVENFEDGEGDESSKKVPLFRRRNFWINMAVLLVVCIIVIIVAVVFGTRGGNNNNTTATLEGTNVDTSNEDESAEETTAAPTETTAPSLSSSPSEGPSFTPCPEDPFAAGTFECDFEIFGGRDCPAPGPDLFCQRSCGGPMIKTGPLLTLDCGSDGFWSMFGTGCGVFQCPPLLNVEGRPCGANQNIECNPGLECVDDPQYGCDRSDPQDGVQCPGVCAKSEETRCAELLAAPLPCDPEAWEGLTCRTGDDYYCQEECGGPILNQGPSAVLTCSADGNLLENLVGCAPLECSDFIPTEGSPCGGFQNVGCGDELECADVFDLCFWPSATDSGGCPGSCQLPCPEVPAGPCDPAIWSDRNCPFGPDAYCKTSCNGPYQNVGSLMSADCGLDGTWSISGTGCPLEFCDPVLFPVIDGVTGCSGRFSQECGVGFECLPDETDDCDENERDDCPGICTNTLNPLCPPTRVTAGDPCDPAFLGDVSCPAGPDAWCQDTCFPSLVNTGASEVATCDPSGVWVTEVVGCEPIDCPDELPTWDGATCGGFLNEIGCSLRMECVDDTFDDCDWNDPAQKCPGRCRPEGVNPICPQDRFVELGTPCDPAVIGDADCPAGPFQFCLESCGGGMTNMGPSVIATCDPSGVWIGQTFECEPIECDPFLYPLRDGSACGGSPQIDCPSNMLCVPDENYADICDFEDPTQLCPGLCDPDFDPRCPESVEAGTTCDLAGVTCPIDGPNAYCLTECGGFFVDFGLSSVATCDGGLQVWIPELFFCTPIICDPRDFPVVEFSPCGGFYSFDCGEGFSCILDEFFDCDTSDPTQLCPGYCVSEESSAVLTPPE